MMDARQRALLGCWQPGTEAPAFTAAALVSAVARVRETTYIVRDPHSGAIGVGFGGGTQVSASTGNSAYELLATLPALFPEWLGDRTFCEAHGVRFPYIAGEMANGIATTAMVMAMGRAQMLGFFGAAGLARERVERAIVELNNTLGDKHAWGVNLIHSPHEPALENAIVDLLLAHRVARVSASAFMKLTPALIRYAATGLNQDAAGRIVRRNFLFAKLSRRELARQFMSPPPLEILRHLVDHRLLTAKEASLAERLPVCEDITVEADSGGHTDNQALTALLPSISIERDQLSARFGYRRPIRVGAAGGISTPNAVAAAFSLGAAYVLTGSVNQAAIESGLSAEGKKLLAEADVPDVMMAPAADMFELGVKVQVLRRGTMFGVRAAKLYDLYKAHDSLEAIADATREKLEKDIFGTSCAAVWAETKAFWSQRDASQVALADNDPKHRMALIFRWYLGKASRWAIDGDPQRRADYQIWCGPAMGAFNNWVAGSALQSPEHRTVVQIALNLLEGGAVITRAQQLRTYGAAVPSQAFHYRPRIWLEEK